MRSLFGFALATLTVAACAGTSPSPGMPTALRSATPIALSRVPITSHDRVYTANQTSNTVSVVDPGGANGGTLLGEILLGAPRTEVLSAIYRGQLNVHGLGFSPDHRTLAVVSVGSNSVTFIDTATNAVKAVTYIGRAPHETFFTPDGKEVWTTVRGQDYVSIIDAATFKETARIAVADGPGMTLFRPDGRVAFVVSSFTPEVDVIDMQTRTVIARIPVTSPFSPNLFISADGREVWMTHKDVGKVTVIDAQTFKVRAVLVTGPITNHVVTVDLRSDHLAFVSVGGLNQVKVFRRDDPPTLVATLPTGALPHGLWPSDDQTRVFVGLENGDAVAVLDVATLKEIGRISIGQAPQALVYVSGAVPEGSGTSRLTPLGESQRPLELSLTPTGEAKVGGGLVVVRTLGLIDTIDINVFGLRPDRVYVIALEDDAQRTRLAAVRTNAIGAGAAQVTGPVRQSSGAPSARSSRRIVVTEGDLNTAPQLQALLP